MKTQWLKKVAAVSCAVGLALVTVVPTNAAETTETTEGTVSEVSEDIEYTEYTEYAATAASAYTGLADYGNNVWRYQVNGVVQETYTGLVEYYGTWYYIENGTLNWNYTGLTKYYNTWYYVEQGRLNWGYTGLTEYYGTWYYVEQGRLNWDYTGLTNYYDTWYYVENGVLNWEYIGLTNYYDTWYYVEQGRLNWEYTGLTNYYDTWYYIENGVLNWNYTGLTVYYDTWYYIEQGRLNWNYTGIVSYGNMQYYVENGIVDSRYFQPITPWWGDLYSLPNNTFFGPMAGSQERALAMQNQYAKYNCQLIGDTTRNVLYLTFVCGWETVGLTDSILDTLKSRGVKAVFCVTGEYMRGNPRIVRRIIDEGHTIANHSWSHQYYTSMSVDQQRNDLLTMHQEMINRFGYTMKYFVFPSETTSERSLAVVGSCGYKTLGFTCYYADYDMRNQKPPQVAIDILNRGAFPGAVYYLHTASTTNAAILGPWIDSMRSIGYQFELFQR